MNILYYRSIIDEDAEILKSYLKKRDMDIVILNKANQMRDDLRMYHPTVVIFDYLLAQEKKFQALHTLQQEEKDIYKILRVPTFMNPQVLEETVEGGVTQFLISESAMPIEIYFHLKFIESKINLDKGHREVLEKYHSILEEFNDYKDILKDKNKEIVRLNEKIESTSVVDMQIDLFNFKYFEKQAEKIIEENARYRENCSILNIEVDNRFQIEEIYGKEGKIFINRECAKVLLDSVRNSDLVAVRDDHEVFYILYKKIKVSSVRLTAQRLKKKLEDTIFLYRDKSIRITVSIGLASSMIDYTQHLDFKMLNQQAGIALDNAIKKGRNIVVAYAS